MEVNSVIYCIGSVEYSVCKIGFTQNINMKLAELQVQYPFKISILGLKEGGYAQEQILHSKFRSHNINGEWFKLHNDIREYFHVTETLERLLIYPEYMQVLIQLTCITDIRMLMLLASNLKFNEYCIVIDPELRKDMMKKLGITTQSFSNSIKRLSETDLLKKRNNKYIINPLYIWKGTDEERKKLLINLNIETL